MKNRYNELINSISALLSNARKKAITQVNYILIETYWHIGKQIVIYEQGGRNKAEYGDKLLNEISKDLQTEF